MDVHPIALLVQNLILALSPARRHRRGHPFAPGKLGPMKTRIFITLKNGVLDPQGKAIHHALEGLGFAGINDVRQGKMIELDLADSTSDAQIEDMCRQLLANTVIENYRIERG
jgi:phosphoribosylformylglycinamidine synthase subunit PurS